MLDDGQDAQDDHLEGTLEKRKDPRIRKEKRRKLREFYDQNKSSERGTQPECILTIFDL
jgi:hypothetical protein